MKPQRFRKKPGEVEAMSWSGRVEDAHPIIQWVNGTEDYTAVWREYRPYSSGGLFPQEAQDRIDEGIYLRRNGTWKDQHVAAGDYVIRNVEGDFLACKKAIFEATYEVVSA